MNKIVIGQHRGSRRRRSTVVDKEQLAQRRTACAHALLNRSWIAKEREPELYYWIKDQFAELRDWFMEHTGFSLVVTRSIAKLDKAPVAAWPWMGFPEFREPLDYAFFTYGLWYLEGKTELDQFLLTQMVEDIREHMVEQGMEVDWKNYYHRLSMARALKKLKALGILRGVDGDEADWAQDMGKNVLYECSAHSRYVLRRFPRELTAYRTAEELSETILYPDSPDGAKARRKHRIYKRFLLEPVVLDGQWTEEELYYVATQRRSLIEQMNMMFGWEGRRYREGLLFFHPEPTSESELFPTLSAVSDLVLLIAGEIRRRLNDPDSGLYTNDDGTVRISQNELEHMLYRLKERHKEFWSKEHREAPSGDLAKWAFDHMLEWGLGRWEDAHHFLVYPVVGRWNAEYRSQEFDT
ncbi:TIGR02678 family protein [Paenibacillus sp. GYB003]|uniref:TIGR02678 family protein n=1 Tax=Paenibacillus sp. GYB003 TaxID=2994392 RepID=UPI002F9617AA